MKYKLIAALVLTLVLVGLYVVTGEGGNAAPASTDNSGTVLHP